MPVKSRHFFMKKSTFRKNHNGFISLHILSYLARYLHGSI